MTTPSTTGQQDTSLTRDLIYAARYYLGRPRVLLTLATVAIVAGLALNWSWLVAVGLAPILLSTLPCVIMCGFGVCMMCRSAKEQSAPARDAAQALAPPESVTLAAIDNPSPDAKPSMLVPAAIETAVPPQVGTPKMDEPSAGPASCCHGTGEAEALQTIDLQPSEERKVPNA
jgi:predicted membrane-bound mannosyltransferase